MTNRQVETSRELRLWIGQVIVPAVTGGIILWSNPKVRSWAKSKINGVKQSIKNRKRG